MVRAPSIDKNGMKKGAWSEEEDDNLRAYVQTYGHWNWRQLPKFAGLNRCGKSCRLRWMNYLKPGVRRGNYTHQEEELILKLHQQLGNKWSVIATKLQGRTDNDIKNHWHTHLRRKGKQEDSKSSSDYEETCERISQQMEDSDHNNDHQESSSSMSTLDSTQRIDDQMETNHNNSAAAAAADHHHHHAYSEEVSSISQDSTQFDDGVLLDWAAQDSMSSVEYSVMEEPFDLESSFWTQPFVTDASFNYVNLHDHQQIFPAALEEEIMRPFSTPYLDEINIDWLHEFLQ